MLPRRQNQLRSDVGPYSALVGQYVRSTYAVVAFGELWQRSVLKYTREGFEIDQEQPRQHPSLQANTICGRTSPVIS